MVDYPLQAEAEFMAEQPYNAADPKQVNNARKRAARERKEELDFIRAIMSSPPGRKWMCNMLNACSIFGDPIVPNDTHLTYARIGQQNIGKKLLIDIGEGAPDEYVLMKREEQERNRL